MLGKWSLRRTVPPNQLPTTVAEVKSRLNLSDADTTHDTKIDELIEAATDQIENDLNQGIITQTYQFTFEKFPTGCSIKLPKKPVQSISEISYKDTNGDSTVVATSVYSLDIARREVYLNYDQSWPDQEAVHQEAVTITFVVGYGGPSDVPRLIKQAIDLMVGKWFDDPAMESNDNMRHDAAYNRIVERLLDPFYAS